MAIPFIKTNLNRWDLAENFQDVYEDSKNGIPTYGSKPIPVISCIGSSRDGKSTLLNVLHKIIKTPKDVGYISGIFSNAGKIPASEQYPFQSKNGNNMVTNGIDFLKVDESCILMDCQGMALKDAKYDHYLTLMIYLTSTVIILNVRQRLDLQVLNNMLAVFSFLSEIPIEHRRKDGNKPTLVIRIKDFQDFELLEENPDYLKEMVDEWLEKSGDQYDQIKEAFKMAFNINIVYTEHPVFPPRKSTLAIYDRSFDDENKSFIEACKQIIDYAMEKEIVPNRLLEDPNNIRRLVEDLKNNANIDYRKLDLYHNITKSELLDYVVKYIKVAEFTDREIIQKMDGSISAYDLYMEREAKILALEQEAYFNKFKDVTMDVKNEQFKKEFDALKSIIEECRVVNRRLAYEKIKPHMERFEQKFDLSTGVSITKLVSGFLDIFVDKRAVLLDELVKIDYSVMTDIVDKMNEEERLLQRRQTEIARLNNSVLNSLNDDVKCYNCEMHYTRYTCEELEKQIKAKNHNVSAETTYGIVAQLIKNDLNKIYANNDKVYYINRNNEIAMKEGLIINMDDFITPNKPEFYYCEKLKMLTDMVFVKEVSTSNMFDMVHIRIDNRTVMMTTVAFYFFYKNPNVQKFFSEYGYLFSGTDQIKRVRNDVGKNVKDNTVNYQSILKMGGSASVIDVALSFPPGWTVPPEMMNTVKNEFYKMILFYIRENPRPNGLIFVC